MPIHVVANPPLEVVYPFLFSHEIIHIFFVSLYQVPIILKCSFRSEFDKEYIALWSRGVIPYHWTFRHREQVAPQVPACKYALFHWIYRSFPGGATLLG